MTLSDQSSSLCERMAIMALDGGILATNTKTRPDTELSLGLYSRVIGSVFVETRLWHAVGADSKTEGLSSEK